MCRPRRRGGGHAGRRLLLRIPDRSRRDLSCCRRAGYPRFRPDPGARRSAHGTPLLTEEGYVGEDVHRAARIAAAGHGGQVLVSVSTGSLVDLELRDLGEHRFKDLSAPERVLQLGAETFPPLKTLHQTNLPVPQTPFLSRGRELDEVLVLLERDDVRLLTLTGPGGTGKTRLAVQAAGERAERYPQGIFWVPLAPFVIRHSCSRAPARSSVRRRASPRTSPTSACSSSSTTSSRSSRPPDLSSLLGECPRLEAHGDEPGAAARRG